MGEAQLRVAVDEDVPRNSVLFVRHFREQETCFGEEVAFGVEVEEGGGEECAGGECAGFEEVGVEGFAVGEAFVVCEVAELAEEVARLWR